MLKICEHPGCLETFITLCQRGKPPLYCPEHRKTKYAMIRARKYPELKQLRIDKLPQCCKDAGNKKCPQHKQSSEQRMDYQHSLVEQAIISDLIDVWGSVSMLNDRGWQIGRISVD